MDMIKLLIEYRYKNLFTLITVLSVLALAIAYFTEYVLDFAPCPLCLYQRIPYFVIIIFSTLALIYKKFYKLGLTVIILSLISSIVISAYHSGVERKIFLPLDTCKNSVALKTAKNFEEYERLIENAKTASCTEPAFTIFGLSMAEYNLIANIILLLLLTRIIFIKSLNAKT